MRLALCGLAPCLTPCGWLLVWLSGWLLDWLCRLRVFLLGSFGLSCFRVCCPRFSRLLAFELCCPSPLGYFTLSTVVVLRLNCNGHDEPCVHAFPRSWVFRRRHSGDDLRPRSVSFCLVSLRETRYRRQFIFRCGSRCGFRWPIRSG